MNMHIDPMERQRQADVALDAINEVRENILSLVSAGYIPHVAVEKLFSCFQDVRTKYQDIRSEAWDEIESEMANDVARIQAVTA